MIIVQLILIVSTLFITLQVAFTYTKLGKSFVELLYRLYDRYPVLLDNKVFNPLGICDKCTLFWFSLISCLIVKEFWFFTVVYVFSLILVRVYFKFFPND